MARLETWGLGVVATAAGAAALVACSGASSVPADPLAYLHDPSFRRAELTASLVNPANEYSSLRLAHYDTGDASDWSLLPEWNPTLEPVAAAELDAPGGASTASMSASAAPLALPGSVTSMDDSALVALGEVAFRRYPVQLTPSLGVALQSRGQAARYGLWVDEARGVGGVVRARMPDGSVALEMTCSTCHSAHDASGRWTPGLPDSRFDLGAAMLFAQGGLLSPALSAQLAAWGPGRLDVTTREGTEPVRIPDLRPARWLTYLQQDATVRARDRVALAIRIETLVVTSNASLVRPPRLVALALAAYLCSLADALPGLDQAAVASPRGAALFASHCASCHADPGLTGEPVPLARVGTDPALGRSKVRGTGTYRVPSLRGVGTRGPLLHDGTIPSLAALLDPARLDSSFDRRLHGAGAVPGHAFGLNLPAADRAALAAYLGAL